MISIDSLISAFQLDLSQGFTAMHAQQIEAAYFPPLNPNLGALIIEVNAETTTEGFWSVLQKQYSNDHPVRVLRSLQGMVTDSSIGALDSQLVADAVYLPPMTEPSSVESLQDTVAHLRAPDGCPWDQEQTHRSLRKHMLEEAYETLEAIDREDLLALREELGDLLLQILMHAQIAQEEGNFRMSEVVADIQAKLIRRHPHVFGDLEVSDVDQVLVNWEHFKSEETDNGPLDGVPRSLPALAQATELQDRASRVGFAWPTIDQVMEKVREELIELEVEVDPSRRANELGDLLFAIVNYARWITSDPEAELQRASMRFRSRFSDLLEAVSETGQNLKDLEITEMLKYWDATKDPEI